MSGTRTTLMRRRNRTNPPRSGGSLIGNEGLKRGGCAADSNIGFGSPSLDDRSNQYKRNREQVRVTAAARLQTAAASRQSTDKSVRATPACREGGSATTAESVGHRHSCLCW